VPNAILGIALPKGREGRVSAEVTEVTTHTIVKWDEVPGHPSTVVKREGAKRSYAIMKQN
jgi:hypothetical protein